MALSLFAAECLVRDYLDGRTLPRVLHSAVVQAAEARLVDGLMPVLTETLCREMDSEATVAAEWSIETCIKAAQDRSRELHKATAALWGLGTPPRSAS
jgi:hypothetical protein